MTADGGVSFVACKGGIWHVVALFGVAFVSSAGVQHLTELLGLLTSAPLGGTNLVDSASSHTLVSKIKPCMSKYKSFTLKLRTAHYISYTFLDNPLLFG